MAAQTPDRPARQGWGAWLGMGTVWLCGWALAALAAVATIYFLYDAESTLTTQVLVFSALTAGPAVALWFTRNRYWRSLSVGLASAWIFSLWLVLVWHPWSTMSTEEVARATAEIGNSGVPAFYLGPRADQFAWNDHELSADQVNFFYGKCHDGGNDEGCDFDIAVWNSRTDTTLTGDFIKDCKRLDPVLGAPTVTLGAFVGDGPDDDIGVFTGSTMVIITFSDDTMSLDQKVSVAEGLRPIGAPHTAQLPPASATAASYVDRWCGPEPR
jgi:hypothetical protein